MNNIGKAKAGLFAAASLAAVLASTGAGASALEPAPVTPAMEMAQPVAHAADHADQDHRHRAYYGCQCAVNHLGEYEHIGGNQDQASDPH